MVTQKTPKDQNSNDNADLARMRADRERANTDGDTDKVAELDEQIRQAEQGNTK